MVASENWCRFFACAIFIGTLASVGCGSKPTEAPKAEDNTKLEQPGTKPGETTKSPTLPDKTSPPVQPPVSITPSGIGLGDEDLSKVQPDFKMTAQEWKAAAEDVMGRMKYKGKVIELTALVTDLYHPEDQEKTVLCINDPDSKIGIGVYPAVKGKEAWKKVLPGQTVTLRGRYSPAHFAELGEAQIIAVTGKPCETVTVDELVAATKTAAEAKEKYDDKTKFVLTGKVLAIRKDTGVAGRVDFVMTPPDAKLPLVIGVASSTLDRPFSTIKAGQTIRVLGTLQPQKAENHIFADALLEVR